MKLKKKEWRKIMTELIVGFKGYVSLDVPEQVAEDQHAYWEEIKERALNALFLSLIIGERPIEDFMEMWVDDALEDVNG
jgi:hypothetical protein